MLRFEHGDRVRLIVASCLTLVALPVLLREGKDQRAERPPTVAAVAPRGEELASPLNDETATTLAPAAASKPATPPPSTATTDSDPPAFLSRVPATTDSDPPGFLSSVAPPPSNSITLVVPTEVPRWPPECC